MQTHPFKISFLLCALVMLWLPACVPAQPGASSATLTVVAAASLADSFNEIGVLFETQHPGVDVVFNFAGSNQLAQQIIQGAPADVFASANQTQMNAVIEAGRVEPGSVTPFGYNRLVVIHPQGNPAGLTSLVDLSRPGLKLILAAREVPVGQYSLEFLDNAARDPAFPPTFRADVLANVVSYENNVKAVLTKVSLGEADAGIVYASDVTGAVGVIEIPPELNVLAAYPIAPLSDSQNPTLAQSFVDLVRSPEGQSILMNYGFQP